MGLWEPQTYCSGGAGPLLILFTAVGLVAGCRVGGNPGPPECAPDIGTEAVATLDLSDVTVLLVIDDSSSMCAVQAALRDGIPALVDDLVAVSDCAGDSYETRVGVITTDMLDPTRSGNLANTPHVDLTADGCTAMVPPLTCPPSLPLFTSLSESDFADEVACLAAVGTAGADTIDPFAAVEAALAPGMNDGFLLDGSHLEIVIITDGEETLAGEAATVAMLEARDDIESVGVTTIIPGTDSFAGALPVGCVDAFGGICLPAAPCTEATSDDVDVVVNTEEDSIVLAADVDFALESDPACAGGARLALTDLFGLPAGVLSISYPLAGDGCECLE